MSTQITTGKVRFSYCNLFTPRAVQEGATPKYSVTLLIPKSDKATMQKIKAAMDEATSLELYQQANKRLHRPGQKKTVLIHHILMKDTYDYRVLDDILAPKEVRQNACLEALKARIKEVSK